MTVSPALRISNLAADRLLVESELASLLDNFTMPEGGPVHRAMAYAVLGHGQRLRPVIALRAARLLNAPQPLALRAAACVELLHCASLIVDDLPSMDNEAERRGRPTTHIAYGESTALLAAFALIALAARALTDPIGDPTTLPARVAFQSELLKILDCGGLIAGQAMDLALTGPARDQNRAFLTELKTVPLFLIAARAGLVFAPPSPRRDTASPALLRFGREYGIAYQMTDDLLDGEWSDRAALLEQYARARLCLQPCHPHAHQLEEMVDYLNARLSPPNHRHR